MLLARRRCSDVGTKWGLGINVDKTKMMVITGVCGPAAVCSLQIDDKVVEQVVTFRYLGVEFQCKKGVLDAHIGCRLRRIVLDGVACPVSGVCALGVHCLSWMMKLMCFSGVRRLVGFACSLLTCAGCLKMCAGS